MSTLRLIRLLFLAASLLIVTDSMAQRLPGQAVTYRNFDYVRAVTSSVRYAYYATTGGIIRYDKLQQRWDTPQTSSEEAPLDLIERIWVDQFDQSLFVSTESGLYEYDDFFDRWNSIDELPVIDNDVRHIAAPDIMLPEFSANYMGDGELIDYYGRHFATTDIVLDPSGDMWIGTWGYGPAQGESSSRLMRLLPYGLLQDRVGVILRDDSLLWLGGEIFGDFRTGLSALQPSENRFVYLESGLTSEFPATDVRCLESDSTRLFVGTPAGLFTVNKSTGVARGPLNVRRGLLDDFVVSLLRTGDSLFVGTAGGLSLTNLKTDSVVHIRPETFHQRVIYDLERVDNTIWIASGAGAFRYTPETDRLQKFQDPDLVLFSSVLNIEHHDGQVWLASDAGVVRLDLTTGKSESFREAGDWRDRRALAVNDRLVALADDIGLYMIVLGKKKTRTYRLTTDDGLASNSVLSLRFDGDYLWIGTDKGLTRFFWNDPRWID
jgi:ligand-binding sensor domain-containing protein